MTTTPRSADHLCSAITIQDVYVAPAGYAAEVAAVRLTLVDAKAEVDVVLTHYDASTAVGKVIERVHLGAGQVDTTVLVGLRLETGDKLQATAAKANVVNVHVDLDEVDTAASIEYFEETVPAVATAGNDDDTPVLVAPCAGTISSVTYITKTAITGADTNTRKVSLINKGAAGAGSTEVAALQFNSGINTVAFDEKTITLSVTPANLVVAAGDVLSWKSLHIVTGIVDPGGRIRIGLTRS